VIELVPSILSADLGRLAQQVSEAAEAGADRFQVDVMDGHFVPNLTFGPDTVRAVRAATDLPIEVHLMVEHPDLFVAAFAEAGASLIQVQVESTPTLYRSVQKVLEAGCRAGVVLNPATPVESLRDISAHVDLINVMTIEPGCGGQHFIESSPEKIRRVRELAPQGDIEVDGGIDVRTAPAAVAAGARLLVAGTAVFGHPGGVAAGIGALRKAVE